MSRLIVPFFALALTALPAAAQVRVEVSVPVPTIRFQAPPPLVVVRPGVQVIENYDDDVYVVNHVYYVRRGDRWYRSRDHRGSWAAVPVRAVPVAVTSIRPGQYRHYRGGHDKHDRHDDHGWIPPGHRKDHGNGHGKGHGKGHGRGHH